MRSACVVGTLVLAGCAAPRHNTTWDEDRRDGVAEWSAATVTHAQPATRRRALTLNDTTVRVDIDALAHEIELELLRFPAQRRAIAQDLGHISGAAWPTPMVTVFDHVLSIVERGMATPHGMMPKRVLMQTRVTLEVELDHSRRQFGEPPDTITSRIRAAFVQVALHMRAGRQLARRSTKPRYDVELGWPLTPLVVTSPYGYRRDPILGEDEVRFHAGVDLGGNEGDVVSAAGPGRVSSVGWVGGHGRTVVVQHPGGYVSMYAHLKRIIVAQGEEVHRGTPVGLVGSTGRSTGPHLHFEIRRGSVPLDPMDAVGMGVGSLAASGL